MNNRRNGAISGHHKRRANLRPNYDGCRVEPDRFNAGEYVVKDQRGSVLASGFDSCDEANEWLETKQRG